MKARTILIAQTSIILICLIAGILWALNFPYPSPLIKKFLEPKQRYPAAQIVEFVNNSSFPKDFLEFFNRDPERTPPRGNNLVSPADGFVREILQKDGITYLMIQLTFWDVHIMRSPVSGIAESIEEDGLLHFKNDPNDIILSRGKVAPVQKILTIATPTGKIKVRMITNYWASRVKVWTHIGKKIEKGERIGQMLAGSTVVLEIPGNINLPLKTGQQVVAGESIIFSH